MMVLASTYPWLGRVAAPKANTALVQGRLCSLALSVALAGHRDASFRHFALADQLASCVPGA